MEEVTQQNEIWIIFVPPLITQHLNNMQQAAKKVYPGLLKLGSEYTGVCRDAAYESVPTIKRVRNALLRITN
ncbi:hypothetical protein DYJ33_22415 [Salmonella enterica]|uniref:Bacteriophage P22 antirepressor protein C-terminal domain-containing protein n=3 Tax=Salmonella enterica TaxID=28901 RepID=A0A633DFV0_SALER|nr:hypothetical protein [Salmonella enterica]EBN6862560.1 hypothetical protein [Salmonella enterica]EDH1793819.1 hypothetical protein [Salmonella enterica]